MGEKKVEHISGGYGNSHTDLLSQAKDMLSEVKEQREKASAEAKTAKDKLLKEAQVECEKIRKRAYQEGYAKGLEKGREAGEEQGKQEFLEARLPVLKKFETLLEAGEESFARSCQKHEDEMLEFVIQIAEKVIRKEIAEDDEIVLKTVKETLARATEKREVTLRLNPEDVNFLRDYKGMLLREFDEIRTLRFESDPRVSQGGCIVETASGCTDGRLEQQLSEIKRSLSPKAMGSHNDA